MPLPHAPVHARDTPSSIVPSQSSSTPLHDSGVGCRPMHALHIPAPHVCIPAPHAPLQARSSASSTVPLQSSSTPLQVSVAGVTSYSQFATQWPLVSHRCSPS
jgi:hypothetical protein